MYGVSQDQSPALKPSPKDQCPSIELPSLPPLSDCQLFFFAMVHVCLMMVRFITYAFMLVTTSVNGDLLGIHHRAVFVPSEIHPHFKGFCNKNPVLNKTVLVHAQITGLTNQLYSLHQVLVLAAKLRIPVESYALLDLGSDCNNRFWRDCYNNDLVSWRDVLDVHAFSHHLGVRFHGDATNNFCVQAALRMTDDPPYDVSTWLSQTNLTVKGRTYVPFPWAFFKTRQTQVSWLNFTKALYLSMHLEIRAHCKSIVRRLSAAGEFHCLHPRYENEFKAPFNLPDAYADDGDIYYVMAKDRVDFNRSNVFTKWSFGNYSSNVRNQLLDACVCMYAYNFTGWFFSSYSWLIASMRSSMEEPAPSYLLKRQGELMGSVVGTRVLASSVYMTIVHTHELSTDKGSWCVQEHYPSGVLEPLCRETHFPMAFDGTIPNMGTKEKRPPTSKGSP